MSRIRHLVQMNSKKTNCGKKPAFYSERYHTRLLSEATCALCVIGAYSGSGATPEQARADYERMLRAVRP